MKPKIKALMAFWKKDRKSFVPLTAKEWDQKAEINHGTRRSLLEAGYVTSDSNNALHVLIYEITMDGILAIKAPMPLQIHTRECTHT